MNTLRTHINRHLAALAVAGFSITAFGQASVSGTFVDDSGTTTVEATFNGTYSNPENVTSFKTTVANAALAGNGGVFTFDGVGDAVSTGSFYGNYATGKTITVTNIGINQGKMADWSIGSTITDRQATSGNNYLSRSTASGYLMKFDLSGSGLAANEGINQVGFTVLSRDARRLELAVRVQYDDLSIDTYGTSNTDSVIPNDATGAKGLQNGNFQTINAGIGTNNTFFLFEAPTGKTITNLELFGAGYTLPANTVGTWFTGVDNLSFTTIPEPSTLVLMGSAFAALALSRLRHRR